MSSRRLQDFILRSLLVLVVCSCTLGTLALAATYTTIDVPSATSTMVYGINNAGTMVGVYIDSQNVTHGFTRNTSGVFTTIDYPGASLSVAAGINNKGEIVGQYNDSAGFGHGFTLISGQFKTVDFAGYQTYPTAVGDHAEIVGFCDDSQGYSHGCTSINGVWSLLDYPGATFTFVLGINFMQQAIAGGYIPATGPGYAFVYMNGKFTKFGFPGVAGTVAFGVNNEGVVIGNYPVSGSSMYTHGFVLYQGVYHTADYPGALATSPINLNDKQVVVGWYTDTANVNHGYSLALK